MIERYTLPEMGKIWTEESKLSNWLEIEILACEARSELGLVPEEAVRVIREKASFDIKRVKEIESRTRHDVVAFLENLAENTGDEAKYIHYGMTSSDILDTGLALQMRDAAGILEGAAGFRFLNIFHTQGGDKRQYRQDQGQVEWKF